MLTIKKVAQYQCLVIKMFFEEQGWAIFRIDEEVGSLTVESDWGNYGYMWGHGGRKGSLLSFLTTCGTEYMGQKLLSGTRAPELFDPVATRKKMKRRARELFSEGRLRLELELGYGENEFELFRSLTSEIHDFCRRADGSDTNTDPYPYAGELVQKVFDPLYEWIKTEPPAWHQVLAKEIVPAFQTYLRSLGEPHVGEEARA